MVRVFAAALLIATVTGGTAYLALTRMRAEDCTRCSLRRPACTSPSISCPQEETSPTEVNPPTTIEPIVLVPPGCQAAHAEVETGQPPRLPATPVRMPHADEPVDYVPPETTVGTLPCIEVEFSLDAMIQRIVASLNQGNIERVSFEEPATIPENTRIEDAEPQVQMPPCPTEPLHHSCPQCPGVHGPCPRYNYPGYYPSPR